MNDIILKFISLGGLFLLTFLFALAPLICIRNLRTTVDPDKKTIYTRVIGLLNCFAGGVFLSTAMLELLPKVTSILSKTVQHTTFPVAEFSVAFGFLIVLVVEHIVIACKESVVDTLSPIERLNTRPSEFEREALQVDDPTVQRVPDLPELVHQKPVPSFRSFLLLLALSLHSIFEGLAIGLQADFDSVMRILFAVLTHKLVISFSLGLNLLQSDMSLLTVIGLDICFALTTPVGVVLGIYLENFCLAVSVGTVNGILQGIACGTFLYVTCFEVLPREMEQGRDRLLKLMAILLGFSIMCGAVFMHCDSDC